MPRTKQTARRSLGGKKPRDGLSEEERERRRAEAEAAEALRVRKLSYKPGVEQLWDVTSDALDANLELRNARPGELDGDWEVYGYFRDAWDWDGSHYQDEEVLPLAGRVRIRGASGSVDVPGESWTKRPFNTTRLTGAFDVTPLESESGFGKAPEGPVPWPQMGSRARAAFWFKGATLRRDDGEGDDSDEDAPEPESGRVGGDFDYRGVLPCAVVAKPVQGLHLLEGDLYISDQRECITEMWFARKVDAPVPFPRADFVRLPPAEVDLAAALARVAELEAELRGRGDAEPPAKRAKT